MAIKVDCDAKPVSISSKPLSVNGVRDRLTATAIATVRALVKDNEDRMAGYNDNLQLLKSGCFYGNEYFKALEKKGQKDRVNYYVNKGSFYHNLAPSAFFYMQPDPQKPTQVVPSRFLLIPGKKPSEALAAIRQGLSFIGCGETCQIGYYEAIREVLGTEKFDMLFAADSPTPLMIHFDTKESPIESLLVKTIPAPKEFKKGQIVPMYNAPLYKIKHLMGEAGGFVTLCCDDAPNDARFTTLGLSSAGVTRDGVNEKLLEELNSEPFGMQAVTAELAKCILATVNPEFLAASRQFTLTQLSKDQFIAQVGGNIPGTCELNAERITLLANSTFAKARKLLTQWHKNL